METIEVGGSAEDDHVKHMSVAEGYDEQGSEGVVGEGGGGEPDAAIDGPRRLRVQESEDTHCTP